MQPTTPTLAVVVAIELSRRGVSSADEWAARGWALIAPLLAGALKVRPGPAGTVLAAWPVERSETVEEAAELALDLGARLVRGRDDGVELRGGIAVGVIDDRATYAVVERWVERLALAASAGQWLVSEDAAHTLERRFVLRPTGLVSRWSLPLNDGHRWLVSRMTPPRLPSAVSGDPPGLVLGREDERRRLLAELTRAGQTPRRQVVLVSAPAGGGKSYLLRRVLADSELALGAGVAFAPLGSRSLDPVRALLAALDDSSDAVPDDRLAEALARAASRRAAREPCAIVVDDIHWASQAAVTTLARAIGTSAENAPLAWVLSMRTAALETTRGLVELVDMTVELPPLAVADRERLVAARIGTLPDAVRCHLAGSGARGNPLYLEHLAEAITEGSTQDRLPATLHEAILMRLDKLAARVRQLAHWSSWQSNAARELEELEREVGDWLDRLETSDIADLPTIGRYLARLRAVDLDLVVARSILRMPLATNRRLAGAAERLAAASTDALLDYLDTMATEGRARRAAHEAQSAAGGAERALRLADAERLLAFAWQHDPQPELAHKRGNLALALGRIDNALGAYQDAAIAGDDSAQLERHMARVQALIGDVDRATMRLRTVLQDPTLDPHLHDWAALDLARLLGQSSAPVHHPRSQDIVRRVLKTQAWARPGDPDAAIEAARSLVLAAQPTACAAELIETAVLARRAGLTIPGLETAAAEAAQTLDNPRARALLEAAELPQALSAFVHWDV
ncbi:MAG TPA: AAA family ATPase [Solirubrobacteraceae bacterium]|nr:AAA family ATPase [Solirubrobacteraceae bacterium]